MFIFLLIMCTRTHSDFLFACFFNDLLKGIRRVGRLFTIYSSAFVASPRIFSFIVLMIKSHTCRTYSIKMERKSLLTRSQFSIVCITYVISFSLSLSFSKRSIIFEMKITIRTSLFARGNGAWVVRCMCGLFYFRYFNALSDFTHI